MIVVTGATGHYGRSVVEGLLSRLSPSEISISVRDPAKAETFVTQGVRVVRGDFADPDTLGAAFDGAEQVLIVSANVLGEEAIRLHGNAIQAAKRAGAKRILYTSHQAASATSKVAFARDHAATERVLQDSGVDFVSLRNGFYAESSMYQLGGMRTTGKLALPGDGPVSWTARNDLAEAAVVALTDTTALEGITAPLTASRTYAFAEIAQLGSGILGQDIAFETVPAENYRQAALQRGFPEPMVGMLLSMFEAIQDGEFNVVDPTLERLLMRRPVDYAAVLAPFLTQGGKPHDH